MRATAERRQDGPELRLAAAQGAGRRRRRGDRHARAWVRAADRPRARGRLPLERLVSEAARAAEIGQPRNGAAREALALWRGEPLADVADEPFAGAEIRRLEELRLTAAELAIDADLAAGRHHEVIAEIDALLAENPLRERLHAQRMLALYRCGRQADALEAYRHAPRDARRRDRRRAGPGAAPPARGDPAPGPVARRRPLAAELPPELDARHRRRWSGRDRELDALRERWQRARPAPARW